MTEDQTPIETALDWLVFIVNNGGTLSPHDFNHILTEVVPEAKEQYQELMQYEPK